MDKKITRIYVEITCDDGYSKQVSWPATSKSHLFEDAANSMGCDESAIKMVTIIGEI